MTDVTTTVRFVIGYRWWLIRHCYPARFRWHLKETLPWKIAWWLPRKVALMAFIRVYSIQGECGPEFQRICDLWTHGSGIFRRQKTGRAL